MMFNINKQDTFHHFLFGIFIGFPGIYYNWGVLRNFLCFGICGLPGFIDYTNLLLVKQGKMSKITQKKICSFLNIWVRVPIICFESFMHYIAWVYSTTTVPPGINILVGVLSLFNCLYYLNSSIRSEERHKNIVMVCNKNT